MRPRPPRSITPALAACLTLVACLCAAGCDRAGFAPASAAPGGVSDGIRFADVTRQAGISVVVRGEGPPTEPGRSPLALTILETMGNGCAFLDYDGDGNLDILVVDRKLTLYRGDGQGRFADRTGATGLSKIVGGHYLGCAVGDYDNDGYDDLYVSGWQTGVLLRNEGGKRFRDVTKAAGLPAEPWGTSCGFVDADRDGRLDLFVANYVDFGHDPARYRQRCEPLACGPQKYAARFPHLYRNAGGGRFEDATARSGLKDTEGKSLAVGFADYDDDGDPDILIANDEVACDLFQNDGAGRFVNRAKEAGTAYALEGKPQGGMGVDWADYDGDGRLDALVTNYTDEPRSLYRNEGDGLFKNTTAEVGLATPTKPFLAFGGKWLDYDNDGWPDLIIANGNVDNNIAVMFPGTTYRQPAQAFRNRGRGPVGGVSFEDVSKRLGDALTVPVVGRGLATGDYDNDGRVDLLVVDDDGPVRLLRNEGGRVGNWIGFSLRGTGKSNRGAHGARVTVQTPDGRTLVREVGTAGSYLSASDRRLHFGLGDAATVAGVTIRWPDGATEHYADLPAGKYHTIRQGQPVSGRPTFIPASKNGKP
jgi:enediyne biosynthesis protein E4